MSEDESQTLFPNELEDVNGRPSSQGWRLGISHLLNHLHMTTCFLFLFISFSSVQNLVSSFHGKAGNWSLATLYICFCGSSLFLATPFVAFLGTKWSLVVGALCYLSFIIANRFNEDIALIVTAGVLGFGASLLWAAQGAYLTISSRNYSLMKSLPPTASMGLFTGIFFGIFQMSQVIGNLISSILLSKYGENIPVDAFNLLMYIYIGIAIAGVIGYILLRTEHNIDEKDSPQESLKDRLFQIVLVLIKPKMLFLIPTIFYSGIEQSFAFGIFTSEIIKPTLGGGHIGYVMALFGVVDVISSLCMGKLSDIFGSYFVVGTGIFCHGIVLIETKFILGLSVGLNYVPIVWLGDNHSYIIYLCAFFWGIGDAAFNLYPNTMMSLHFTSETEPAFSLLKFFQLLIPQSFAAALPFALSTLNLTLLFKMECIFGFLVFSLIGLIYLKVFVDLDPKPKDTKIQ